MKGERADTTHYDVTSLRGAAAEPGRLIRRHWAAENESHWRLDVASREGASGAAAGHAGTNLGLVRRVAASLAKQHPDEGGIKGERLEAALDEGDSLPVLQGFMEG